MPSGGDRPLRPGDIVEVRPAAEILATLDADGTLDDMLFMPENASVVGRRFAVSRRAEKVCDTIAATGSRRVYDTAPQTNGAGVETGVSDLWTDADRRRHVRLDLARAQRPPVHAHLVDPAGEVLPIERITADRQRSGGGGDAWTRPGSRPGRRSRRGGV